MQALLEQIKEGTLVRIQKNTYQVQEKNSYLFDTETSSYISCKLTEEKELNFLPTKNLIYLSEQREPSKIERTNDGILYNDCNFHLAEAGQLISDEDSEEEGLEVFISEDKVVSLETKNNRVRCKVGYGSIIREQEICL